MNLALLCLKRLRIQGAGTDGRKRKELSHSGNRTPPAVSGTLEVRKFAEAQKADALIAAIGSGLVSGDSQ
jgi:hypothetical protein